MLRRYAVEELLPEFPVQLRAFGQGRCPSRGFDLFSPVVRLCNQIEVRRKRRVPDANDLDLGPEESTFGIGVFVQPVTGCTVFGAQARGHPDDDLGIGPRRVGQDLKLLKTLGQLGLALLSLPLAVPAAADPATSPGSQPAQWIVVGVPAANATTGTLTAFQRVGQQWKAVLGPMPAKVGELGVGAPADGVHRTPVGTFTFGQAFGRQPNPGTKMPYFQATDQDWWDEDAGSPTYNTHVRASDSPSSIAENLYDSGPVYDYAVNIAVNPQRIPGRVAGIFLHVTDGDPTWGCVAIGRDEMRSVLNWLDPSASPEITIGVGNPSLVPSGS